jgi:Protein of unknown function (DUF4012)
MVTPFSATAPVSPSVSRRHARRMRRVRDQRVVLAIVAASALLAAMAPAAPTGTRLFDALWCAALGGAASWAGSRSRRWAWLWCSGVVAAGSVGSWWMVVAIAALVLALTGAFFESRARVLGAVVGALVVQSALRMPSQGFFGLPSLVALVALVPLFASAFERSPDRIRTRVRRVTLTVCALAVVASAGLALAAALGRSQLNSAVDSSKAGLEMIRTGRQTEASSRLDAASVDFGHAHDLLAAFWTWPARLVPVVAQHRDALVSASASGGEIARAGSVAAKTAPYQQLKAANGTVDLAIVRNMQVPVAETATALLAAKRVLQETRSEWLLQPVADPLASFATQVDQALPEAVLARDALNDAPALLGAHHDRHYLILFTNPAESRFLGGFTGSYGVLVAHAGKVSFTVGNRISQLFPDRSKVLHLPSDPVYRARYNQYDPADNLQNLTVSPDMPTDAEVTRSLFHQYYGSNLDGVFVVDPYALAALLKLTGPVSVKGLAEPLTAANAARYLIHDQYLIYGSSHDDRKDVLSEAGKATFKALTSRHLPGPRDVGNALGPVVAQKRLLFYPFASELRPLFARVGTLGAFHPDHNSDYLSLRSANGNANKIDWYLGRSVAYDAAYDPSNGNVMATVTIRLRNLSPSSGLPEYMIGNLHDPSYGQGGTVPAGTNTMYVSYYTPLTVQSATVDGSSTGVEQQTEFGRQVYSEFVTIPAGATRTLVFHLEGSVPAGSTYHLQVLSQPLVHNDSIGVRVHSSSPAWHVGSANGLTVTDGEASWSGSISTDQRYTIHFARGRR